MGTLARPSRSEIVIARFLRWGLATASPSSQAYLPTIPDGDGLRTEIGRRADPDRLRWSESGNR